MTEQHIPKIMHHIWIGDPMPSHLRDNCVEWSRLHPDWDMKLWTEAEIDEIGLQNRALYDQAEKIVPADAVEQFRADIVRYEVLALFGGMYADVDTRPLRNIEPALAGHHEFAAHEDRTWVGNTYLAAVPGHPIMPGVLIIEAMAQVGGLLMMDSDATAGKLVYFMTLDNVKWRKPVTPGDQIVFEVELLQLKRNTCRMRGKGTVDGNVVVEGDMMAMLVDARE